MIVYNIADTISLSATYSDIDNKVLFNGLYWLWYFLFKKALIVKNREYNTMIQLHIHMQSA